MSRPRFYVLLSSLILLFAPEAGAQVLNGQHSFIARTTQWRSDNNGDGGLISVPIFGRSDTQNEENVCQIWTEIDGQMVLPKKCHTWSAKNWYPLEIGNTERDFTNITIAERENTTATYFITKADFWENDAGDKCTYEDGFLNPDLNADDRYTENKAFRELDPVSGLSTPFLLGDIVNYDFRNKPQSEWFEYPEAGISLDNTSSSEKTYVKIKTAWNFTHGNTLSDPLEFGTLSASRSYIEHENTFYSPGGAAEAIEYEDNHRDDGKRDIIYAFNLRDEADVSIRLNHPETGSNFGYRVLNEDFQTVFSPSGGPGNYSQTLNLSSLCAGRYYIMLDDSEEDGPVAKRFKISLQASNFNPFFSTDDSKWTVYTYDEVELSNPGKFRGAYTVDGLEVNTDEFFPANGNYGAIPGFVSNACGPGSTGSDYFTHVFRRKFTCGQYGLRLNDLDDHVRVYVDGQLVYEDYSVGSGKGVVWAGQIEEQIEIYFAELAGAERLHFELLPGYSDDWRVNYYEEGSNLYFGYGNLIYDNDGYIRAGFRGFTVSGQPEPIQEGIYNGVPILNPACNTIANTLEDFYLEFTKTGFTPGLYQLEVRNDLIGVDCNNCNFNLQVNGQTIYASQSFGNPFPIYLDETAKFSLFSDIGGVSWSAHFYGGDSPLIDSRSIRLTSLNLADYFDISQSKDTIVDCEAVQVSVVGGKGVEPAESRIQWQQRTDGGNWQNISGIYSRDYATDALTASTQFRYRIVSVAGQTLFTSPAVTVTVVPDPSFVGGTAVGAEAVEPCQIPSTLTVEGSSPMNSYQWQCSPDNVSFTDIPNANSATYTPAVLEATTYFRRVGFKSCGLSVVSSAVAKTVLSKAGFGQGEWEVEVVGRQSELAGSPAEYSGSATLTNSDIKLAEAKGGKEAPPSDLPNYTGCDVANQSFTLFLRKTDWACGRYDFHLLDIDGGLNTKIITRFDIDGDGAFDRTEQYTIAPFTEVERHYYVDLQPSSRVEIEYLKVIGSSRSDLEMDVTRLPLEVSCRDTPLYLSAQGTLAVTPSVFLKELKNACGQASLQISADTFDCSNVGRNDLLLTAVDGTNRTASCSSTLTVLDTVAPEALCQDITVQLDANGSGSASAQAVDDASADACGIASLSLSQTNFGCSEVGPNPETLTVTDVNGNSSTCNATVTVVDTVSPEARCQDVTVQLDANGSGSASAQAVDDASADACGIASLSLSQTNFGCSEVGPNPETLTVTDVNGNSSTCNATVTVVDTIAPTPICFNPTVEIQPDATYTLQLSDVFDADSSFDNCPYSSVSGPNSPVSFPATTYGCSDIGMAFPITVTLEDASGNSSDCTAIVSVVKGDDLPAAWGSSDIGTATVGNAHTFDPCTAPDPEDGEFTITGSGNNGVSSTTDNVAFSYQEVCGNASITAKIEHVSSNGYAGLMVRESSAPGARQVSLFSNLTNVLRHEYRTATGGNKTVGAFYRPFPIWLQLYRQGDWVFAYYSTTGSNFQYVHAAYVPMENCVQIGLASFTSLPNTQSDAVFSHVEVTGDNQAMAAMPGAEAVSTARVQYPAEPRAFPNPTSGKVQLQFPQGLDTRATVRLRNTAGQVLRQRQLQPGDAHTHWDLSAQPGGLYIFDIRLESGETKVLRIAKSR